jgi:hypothetical protein
MNERAVLRVLHENAIRGVLSRYASAIDRLDMEAVRDCYCADAVDDHGTYNGPIDGLLDHLSGLLNRHLVTTHFLGNLVLKFVTEQVAVSEAYALLICRYGTAGSPNRLNDLVAGVRYVDTWALLDGEFDWRVKRRLVVFDWTRIDPVRRQWHETLGFARRARSAEDPWLLELARARRNAAEQRMTSHEPERGTPWTTD